jgi:perosamine synthetase
LSKQSDLLLRGCNWEKKVTREGSAIDSINMAKIELSQSEVEAATKVLRSGKLRQGEECTAFENEFAQKVGRRHALTCSSGSAALHLAYSALLEPGDEVLMPSFTFIATASMVVHAGGRPVFCDVDPETFLMDLEDARSKLSSRTKTLAPVHLFGNPFDMPKAMTMADEHGLKVICDAAQAHGAMHQEFDAGHWGDMACYSFYPSKNMFVGEGGMICCDDDALADDLRLLRSHGIAGKYLHTRLGFNYRMTDVEAAIGRQQLQRLDEMLARRQRNADIYNEAIGDIPGLTPQKTTGSSSHAWHQYCVVVDPGKYGRDRDSLAAYLNGQGVATAIHYPRGLHQQPVFVELYGEQRLPVTEDLARNILALPVHHGLDDTQVERVAGLLADAVG